MNYKKIEAKGRLFFTTDIHGELPTLLKGLQDLGFNSLTDTLVCAGDLIDRGSKSFDTAMHFLTDKTGAFHSVLGNHDVFAFENNHANDAAIWIMNGGQWAFTALIEEERDYFAACMKELPYLIEVSHQGLTYGVVHAGVPEELSWQELVVSIEAGNASAKQECVWMRDYVEYEKHYTDNFCKGVDYTISGHTPVKEPKLIANRLHIDTGLVYGKYLTITEATAEGFTHHRIDMEK